MKSRMLELELELDCNCPFKFYHGRQLASGFNCKF